MKNNLPHNSISKNYTELLEIFIEKIKILETNNLVSVFLTGSFARGEANENSDLDIWCIFNHIKYSTLKNVGTITQTLPVSYNEIELNTQCLTLDEFNSKYFSKFIAYPIIYLEAVLLYGSDIAMKRPQNDDIIKTYKEIISEVLLSIRHYISVNEPAEKLTHQKIRMWVLKPLMFALRLERFCLTEHYPMTISDLQKSYSSVPMSVKYFTDKELWANDIINNHDNTLSLLCKELENLMI